jgi:hypothetical protein
MDVKPIHDNSKPIPAMIADIITEDVFLLGYYDVWADREFDCAKIAANKGCRWAYERGRQFATLQRLHGPNQKLKMQPGKGLERAVGLYATWSVNGWLI